MMEMSAPKISLGSTFSLKTPMEKGMIRIGDMDVSDDTMPAGAYCRAMSERVTPIKGPKIAPIAIWPIAFLSLKAARISGHFFL